MTDEIVSATAASRISIDEVIPDEVIPNDVLDELLQMVCGASAGQAPDYQLEKARQRLLFTLQAARSAYRAKTHKRPWGTRQRELRAVATQAHRLRTAYIQLTDAYGALDSASRAALVQAIRNDGAPVPSMMLDDAEKAAIEDACSDGSELFVTPAKSQLNLPALAKIASPSGELESIEKYAEAAASLPAPKGRPKNEPDLAVVRILASFVDWCGRQNDQRGGGFPSTVSVTSQEEGPFHRFALRVFQVAMGIDDPSASTPLLRTIRNVVDERKVARDLSDASPRVVARPDALLPDPDLEDFGDVPRRFRTRR